MDSVFVVHGVPGEAATERLLALLDGEGIEYAMVEHGRSLHDLNVLRARTGRYSAPVMIHRSRFYNLFEVEQLVALRGSLAAAVGR